MLEEFRLGHVQFPDICEAFGLEISVPVERRSKNRELSTRHLVKDLIRVALIHLRQGRLGQRGFDRQNFPSFRLGSGAPLPRHLKHFRNMNQVRGASLNRFLVFFQIVVAVRQTKPAGAGICDDPVRVLKILTRSKSEQRTEIPKLEMEPAHKHRKLFQRANGLNLIQRLF